MIATKKQTPGATTKMKSPLSTESLNQLFNDGRTPQAWLAQDVSEELLRDLYERMKWAPTCVNGAPARFIFVKTPSTKEKLLTCLMEKNVEKTKTAPVTAIIGYDMNWYEQLPRLFPRADYRSLYSANAQLSDDTAFRNSSLQGAYFMLAARSLGLDVGPMSGFDLEKLNRLFFSGTPWRANFLCNLGYGDPNKIYQRGPRLQFSDVCRFV